MQFLKIPDNCTLVNLSNAVGESNVDSVLNLNGLDRTPNVGKNLKSKCAQAIATSKEVNWQTKQNVLNSFAGEADVYEQAALQDSNGWKVLSSLSTFTSMLRIPESVVLPNTANTIGNTGKGVSSDIYTRSMNMLKKTGKIDPSIFNEYVVTSPAMMDMKVNKINTKETLTSINLQLFNIPWGKISLYSSLANDSIDFPVYPEEYSDERSANYTTMPELLYQYEPWQIYKDSGPVIKDFTFTFHRDMWSGDHRDGKANQLVRFCQACCYPRYNGSQVDSGFVTLYINGSPAISGVMTKCRPEWSGPLGLDGFYLVCKLSISITEVSKKALNFNTVRSMSLIGD